MMNAKQNWLLPALLVSLVLGGVGCDERSPVAPAASPPTVSAPTAPATRQITGVVRDDHGSPVAGAALTVYPGNHKLVSDAAGQFDVTVATSGNGSVFATKPDYESTYRYFSTSPFDVVLHDIIRLPVGQSARITVRPDDSIGGWDEEYRYRVLRVASSESVRAEIHVIADDNQPADYWVQSTTCCTSPSVAVVDIPGGTERQVEVRIPWNATASRTFTVITSSSGS